MKLAIAWFTVLALSVAISCSVNHRSGEFACTKQADCMSPRTCVEGFCIVPDGIPIDGPRAPNDATPHIDGKVVPTDSPVQTVCPTQCTSCDLTASTCKIECGASNSNCNAEVVCPPGFSCLIQCNAAGACRNGVVCTDANACTIQCGGANSCRNIMCGSGPCDLTCSGSGSCHGVDCADSCACDVSCSTINTNPTCQNVICSSIACSTGLGCSSQSFQCDTCTH